MRKTSLKFALQTVLLHTVILSDRTRSGRESKDPRFGRAAACSDIGVNEGNEAIIECAPKGDLR